MKILTWIIFLLQLFNYDYIYCFDWKQTHYEKYEAVESMVCIDSNVCYSIVNHPSSIFEETGFRIYKSLNKGQSWFLWYKAPYKDPQGEPTIIHINSGCLPLKSHFFIASDDNSIILKSNDSGKTFKKIILETGSYRIKNLAMYDTNYGFASNDNAFFTTNDGWETFERLPRLNSVTLYSPLFLDTNIMVMTLVSNNNPYGFAFVKYYINENRFDTLSFLGFNNGADQTANDFQRIYNIYFVNDTLGFGCGSSRVHQGEREYFDMIYRTTDGGYIWKTVFRELNYPEVGLDNNISFADEKNGIAVGFYGKIAMTNDGGDTWVYEPTPNEMDNCRKMQVCWAGHTPLIGTWDAGIFRYEGDFFKFPQDTTSVAEDNLITNYQLLITPNPAGDYITIYYKNVQTPNVGVSTGIAIYNVLGECVLTLPETLSPIPETLSPIPQKVDVSELPAGVYFVRIGNEVKMFVKG